MQERILWGPLDRISSELNEIEILKEDLEQAEMPDHIRLEKLRERRDDLLAQKADLSIHEVQLQSALKLIDAIRGAGQRESAICLIPDITPDEPKAEPSESIPAGRNDDPAACRDLADFYARTDRIDQEGPVCIFDHTQVKRFIDKVTIYQDHVFVAFKAGVGIKVQF